MTIDEFNDRLYKNNGEYIKTTREANGVSIQDFADMACMTPDMIMDIEAGKTWSFPIEVKRALKLNFGVDLNTMKILCGHFYKKLAEEDRVKEEDLYKELMRLSPEARYYGTLIQRMEEDLELDLSVREKRDLMAIMIHDNTPQ